MEVLIMEDLIKWLEANPDLIIAKTKSNISTFEELEATIVIEHKILCPSTALELAEIFEEELNLLAVLDIHEVELPSDVKETIVRLTKASLTKMLDVATVEANNNGNLALFINTVANKVPVPTNIADLVNVNDNMISLNFRSHEEGVTTI